MFSAEQIRERIQAAFPGCGVELAVNPAPSAQHALRVPADRLIEVARFLRDDPALRLDYCSNVTGVDWPEREVVETRRVAQAQADGSEQFTEEKVKVRLPGCIEVVYHLYSMAAKHGPVVLKVRTQDRSAAAALPSLTAVWRSCELQEREVYDLFGVRFDGHPDLRRLLMWEEFVGHPMRRDYEAPDDHEWEPTPHDAVLERARRHYPAAPGGGPA